MNDELEILKKRLLYRASYRGTKEMDILMSSFVKKNINIFNFEQLKELQLTLNGVFETEDMEKKDGKEKTR